jgi:TetR/AcrR family transcriptional regulator, mexJK operon transcriptional repressor
VTEGLSERQLAKRGQIARAARRLFLDHGFAGTSMDAVTAEAGVSKQTLYSYFPTKIDLLADVLYGSIGKLVLGPPEQDSLHSLADLREALLAFATRLTQTLLRPDSISLVRLVLGEAFRVPALRQAFRDALPGQVLSRTAALLQQAADAGLIALPNPPLASRMFVGPLMTYVALDGFLSAEPSPPPTRAALEELVDAFLATVAVRR